MQREEGEEKEGATEELPHHSSTMPHQAQAACLLTSWVPEWSLQWPPPQQ